MTARSRGFGIIFPHPAGAGFAMRTLEQAFRAVGAELAGSPDDVHVIFDEASSLDTEPRDEPVETFAWSRQTPDQLEHLSRWIAGRRITTIFGLDLPVSSPAYAVMRRAGVQCIISYWGAPMSSINTVRSCCSSDSRSPPRALVPTITSSNPRPCAPRRWPDGELRRRSPR